MSKLISVVVPTYRRPSLLTNCVGALLRQTFPHSDFEVVIVSDGPDPETAEAVGSLSGSTDVDVQLLQLEKNKGPAAARNAGWQRATGSLIAFTDDDTIPDSGWLENLWKNFSSNDQVVAFTGKIIVPVSEPPTDYELNIKHLETAEFVTANCACSRGALRATGGFDESFTMAWREDSDLHFKLIRASIPIIRVGQAVVVHPVRKAKWGVSIKEQKKSMFNALLYKKYPELYRHKIQRTPPWLYYAIITAAILMFAGVMASISWLVITAALCWLGLTAYFIWKRLARTSRSASHISEMVCTSLVIPFLSVYWRCYGAAKFRVPFF